MGLTSLTKTGADWYRGNTSNQDALVNGGLGIAGVIVKPGLLAYKLAKSTIIYNVVRKNYGKN